MLLKIFALHCRQWPIFQLTCTPCSLELYIYREGERGREGRREEGRAAAAAYLCAQLQPSRSHNHVVKAIEIIIVKKVRREMAMCGCTPNESRKKTTCVLQSQLQTQLDWLCGAPHPERGSGEFCTETV